MKTDKTEQRPLSNLDLLRIVTASAVIFGHAYALNGAPGPGLFDQSIGYLRVKVFFVLSGALLARSWIKDPHFLRYFARRLLRLVPGLAVVVIITAVVIGPLVSKLPASEYFAHPWFWKYFQNIGFHIQFYLPRVFEDNPHPNSVNGALWSLGVEVLMYLLLPLVLWLGAMLKAQKLGLWACTLGMSGLSLYWEYVSMPVGMPRIYGMYPPEVMKVAPFFLIGAVYGLHRWHTRLSLQWAVAMVVILTFFQPRGVFAEVVATIVIPYVVLALAFAKPPAFGASRHLGNYAYGIYLWGFPIQQLWVMAWRGPMDPVLNFALTLPISVALAAASWHGVEKWFQRFRPEAPALPGALEAIPQPASLPARRETG